jgi:tRNA modification GTPase
MLPDNEDTIAAVATPPGRAALGIVRISGKSCSEILPRVFLPRRKGAIPSFRPVLGRVLLSTDQYVDEALATFYERPNSYTREDLAEITCHGNPLILDRVLQSVISCGARLARPGEFTYRAFLNGRVDLVQAEAVQDLISAESIGQAELALQHLGGRLSERFQELKSRFIELISLMEGNIDFSEEQHYTFIQGDEALRRLEHLISEVRDLLGTFDRGKLIREGYFVALVGRPNVGKSSLFNAILGQNRAIVTPIPGTTRDYLQERITLGNFLIHLLDTAGIRESNEIVEQEGIRRSSQVIEKADLILFLVDGSCPLQPEDFSLWEQVKNKERMVLVTKADLPEFAIHNPDGNESLAVSAVTRNGVSDLLERIQSVVEKKIKYSSEDSLISSFRHREILSRCLASLERAREGVNAGLSEEFPLLDLQEGLGSLGEITGEVTVDEIYQHIFSKFCIGK